MGTEEEEEEEAEEFFQLKNEREAAKETKKRFRVLSRRISYRGERDGGRGSYGSPLALSNWLLLQGMAAYCSVLCVLNS